MSDEARRETESTESEGTRRTLTAQERLLLLDLWQRSGLTARDEPSVNGSVRR